ncbi:MAG TPA: cation diffusion facilitator family transporter [Vicinamibacterales bacterium]|nr:cation diffusion facilitator family transporter [Vicinamibacterales bacterium]
MDRHAAVSRVLYRVLLLNLIVAVAKIALGYVSGAISVLSDGFHSLTDTVSNIVGLIGVKISSRPPDVDHPYGHRKFETMASVGILVFLLIVLVQVLWSAAERLQSGGAPTVTALSFAVMASTFLINVGVVLYERREAVRLSSEVLVSDAYHTQSDLLTSATVIAALLAVRAGYPLLDPIAAIVVAVFIGHACWGILKETSRILADQIVIDPEDIQAVVRSVPEVLGCHQIRSRGSTDHVFVDLHVWMDPGMRLDEAHRVSHVVKDRIMAKYPQIKDAVIHLEPPPSELRTKN